MKTSFSIVVSATCTALCMSAQAAEFTIAPAYPAEQIVGRGDEVWTIKDSVLTRAGDGVVELEKGTILLVLGSDESSGQRLIQVELRRGPEKINGCIAAKAVRPVVRVEFGQLVSKQIDQDTALITEGFPYQAAMALDRPYTIRIAKVMYAYGVGYFVPEDDCEVPTDTGAFFPFERKSYVLQRSGGIPASCLERYRLAGQVDYSKGKPVSVIGQNMWATATNVWEAVGITWMFTQKGTSFCVGDNQFTSIRPHASIQFSTEGVLVRGFEIRNIPPVDTSPTTVPERTAAEDAQRARDRALQHYEQGDWDAAIAAGDEAIRLDPQDHSGYAIRGDARHMKGQWSEAMADCNEALRLASQCPYALSVRADLWYVAQQYDKAVADCDAALQSDSERGYAYLIRGKARNAKGDFRNAHADFARAKELGYDLGDRAPDPSEVSPLPRSEPARLEPRAD